MASHKIVSVDGLAVTDGSFDNQTEIDVEGHGASPLQGVSSVSRHRPMARATFRDIQAAIDHFGVSGYEITGAVNLWTALRDDGGGMAGTGTKVAFSDGLVVPSSLTVDHGDLASIDYTIYGGGSTSKPYSIATGASIADMSSAVSSLWTVGAGTLNAADFGPVNSLSIDFSPQIQYEEGDGVIWPLAVYIDQWQITATVDSLDPEIVSSVDAGNTNTISIQINKKDEDGLADTGHLTVAFDQSLVTLDQMQGNRRDNATTSLQITATSSDYSTFPVSIST